MTSKHLYWKYMRNFPVTHKLKNWKLVLILCTASIEKICIMFFPIGCHWLLVWINQFWIGKHWRYTFWSKEKMNVIRWFGCLLKINRMVWVGTTNELMIPELYIYLVQHVINLFTKYIKILEANDFSALELHDVMTKLRLDLEARQKGKLCGAIVKNALKYLDRSA